MTTGYTDKSNSDMLRDALLYHLYSGHLFFTAAALFVLGTLVPKLRVLTLLALPLAALSGTPVSWLVLVALALAIAAAVARKTLLALPIFVVCIAVALELPYHFFRRVHATRLFVIGDSLASGGFAKGSTSWPERLGAVNLARPSDTATTAIEQLSLLPPPVDGDLVLLEIGGNDMLDNLLLADYRRGLESLIRGARPRRVAMLELPLLPGAWRYGAAQRLLARKHGVSLLPKRILAAVLTDPRNTVDGLHLNDRGEREMAREIARVISR